MENYYSLRRRLQDDKNGGTTFDESDLENLSDEELNFLLELALSDPNFDPNDFGLGNLGLSDEELNDLFEQALTDPNFDFDSALGDASGADAFGDALGDASGADAFGDDFGDAFN